MFDVGKDIIKRKLIYITTSSFRLNAIFSRSFTTKGASTRVRFSIMANTIATTNTAGANSQTGSIQTVLASSFMLFNYETSGPVLKDISAKTYIS